MGTLICTPGWDGTIDSSDSDGDRAPPGGNALFTANITGAHGEVDVLSAHGYNFDAVVSNYGATYNGSGQTPPAATFTGVAGIAADGGDVMRINYKADQEQYELGWHKNQSWPARGYGQSLFIRIAIKLAADWVNNLTNRCNVKFIDFPSVPATEEGRLVCHIYARGIVEQPVLELDGNTHMATDYGLASDEFATDKYQAIGMSKDDSPAAGEYATPCPLRVGKVEYLQMEILNKSGSAAADGQLRWWRNTNDQGHTSDPMMYGQSSLFAMFMSQSLALELGSYMAGNTSTIDNIIDIEDYEIGDAFSDTWCPYDTATARASRLPLAAFFGTGDLSEFDDFNADTGLAVINTDSAVGRRCLQFTVTNNGVDANDNRGEWYFADHPGNPTVNNAAIWQVYVVLSVKLSAGYVTFPSNDQKLFLVNFCDAATGTRRFQMMLAIETGGQLIIDRAWFRDDGLWEGHDRYETAHYPTPGEWERYKVDIVRNTPGQANGVLRVFVKTQGAAASNMVLENTAMVWVGDKYPGEGFPAPYPNKAIATSYTTNVGNGQNATIWEDDIMVVGADPGINA
ncbi:MAG: hypothetical protein KUF79_17345 [Candidatus Thiodiazotropha sp. (ex Ctena orbiculata)]|nr:hypothetical protein [Candidatus Thiodiazotropha taylori]